MRKLTYRDAIREALREEIRRDDRVFIMGEDVAVAGGAFNVTEGLLAELRPGANLRHPAQRVGHRGGGGGGLPDGDAACGGGDVRRLHHDRHGCHRQPRRQDALHVRRRGVGPAGAPHGLRWRVALCGPPQPERGILAHQRSRPHHPDARHPRRRQGPAEGGHPHPEPRHLPRAQAALQHEGGGARG